MAVQNSTLSSNKLDGIYTNSSVEIKNCDVWNNTGNGVNAARNVGMDVFSSNILNNTLNGLSGRGYVYYSNVSGNTMAGILGNFKIDNYTSITWNNGGGFNGTGSVYSSSVFNNTPYDAVADILPNNITATYNWWGTNDSASIRDHILDHEDDPRLGCVFSDHWLQGPPNATDTEPPKIVDLKWIGTPPIEYTLDFPVVNGSVRKNEPALVSVHVIDVGTPVPSGVDKVFLSYRVAGGEWWNTTMTYHEKSGNWTAIIPPVPGNSTVESFPINTTIEFFIQAYDKAGNPYSSYDSLCSIPVKWLPIGDVNGDGLCDMRDIFIAILHYGQTDP